MTDLNATHLFPPHQSHLVEEWHGNVLRGRLLACIVVKQGSAGKWKVTAELKDVGFRPVWKTWRGGPYETDDEAYAAGQRAATTMHAAFMAARQDLELSY
jgi:hypothetical protein